MNTKNKAPNLAMVKNARRRLTRKMHQIAFFFIVPVVALLTQWMQKSIKIVENSPQNDHKKYEARFCNGQNHTPSTETQKTLKIIENHRWGHVSTVVPAARRANSKCISGQKGYPNPSNLL